jgi:hypothetical protein
VNFSSTFVVIKNITETGRKKKERETVEKLFSTAMTMPVPAHILEHFEMWDTQKNRDCRVMEIQEIIDEIFTNYKGLKMYIQVTPIGKFKSVVKMIRKHESEIINCLRHGLTNGGAENLNGKLHRFVSANCGLKDRDFFLHSTAGYFSPAPQKKI